MNTYWFNEILYFLGEKSNLKIDKTKFITLNIWQKTTKEFWNNISYLTLLWCFSWGLPSTQIKNGSYFLTKAILFFGFKEIKD